MFEGVDFKGLVVAPAVTSKNVINIKIPFYAFRFRLLQYCFEINPHQILDYDII
jgi:hypothetical protein